MKKNQNMKYIIGQYKGRSRGGVNMGDRPHSWGKKKKGEKQREELKGKRKKRKEERK